VGQASDLLDRRVVGRSGRLLLLKRRFQVPDDRDEREQAGQHEVAAAEESERADANRETIGAAMIRPTGYMACDTVLISVIPQPWSSGGMLAW